MQSALVEAWDLWAELKGLDPVDDMPSAVTTLAAGTDAKTDEPMITLLVPKGYAVKVVVTA